MQARRQRGGNAPPTFVFAPPPLPIYFLPPTVFFWEEEVAFLAGENVEICDFRQKKASDFGEDLFFFLEITCFWPEKNVKISARKSLRKSAKTFAPPILILPPRSREAGDAPVAMAFLITFFENSTVGKFFRTNF